MFGWSDAWLLLALIYSGEPADRVRLRTIGDFINHAIFYSPSAEVLAWYRSTTAGKSRTAVHKDVERVNRFLGLTKRS